MPIDPFEQLNTLFTDIADAIRSRDGDEEKYQEEVVTDAAELRNIINENTGYSAGSRVTGVLTKETHKCLMTESIYKNYPTYYEGALFLLDSAEGDLTSEDGLGSQDIDISSDDNITVITNNSAYTVTVRAFSLNSGSLWNTILEEPSDLAPGASKTYPEYGLYEVGTVFYFSNTKLVPVPTEIKAVDFPRRISSSAPAGNATSLNKLFTDVADAIRSEKPASTKNAQTYEEYNTLLLEKTGYGIDPSSHIRHPTVNENHRVYFVKMKDSDDNPRLLLVHTDMTKADHPELSDIVVEDTDNNSVKVTNLIPSATASFVWLQWYYLTNNLWGMQKTLDEEATLDPDGSTTIANMSLDGEPFLNTIPVVEKFSPADFPSLIRSL